MNISFLPKKLRGVPEPLRIFLEYVIACVLFLIVLYIGARIYIHYRYPYGGSHCCLKALGMSLMNYALSHEGHYPAGGNCPEASLCMLYRDGLADANLLRGKTVPEDQVKAVLERGEFLDPDNCGWNYVEGLTMADDARIAIVWDKIGLGHNGEDLHGGHSVWFLNGEEVIVPASKWSEFLETQKQLTANRTENAKRGIPALKATVRMPSGMVVDHYGEPYTMIETDSLGKQSTSGQQLESSKLRWWRLPDGERLFCLKLNGTISMTSKPVAVDVRKGMAFPCAIVFEMEEDTEKPAKAGSVNSSSPPEKKSEP